MKALLPSVLIVTPSFNQGQYLDATIQSVLQQDYPNLLYRVIDGGSTDTTLDVLRSYDEKIQWVSQPDDGQTDAIMKGFDAGGGQILTWLNSDDTLAPDAVGRAAEYLAAHPEVAVVYGDADFIDPAGRFLGKCAHIEPFDPWRLLHVTDFIVQPAAFFRRSALEAVGGLDRKLHWSMDYDLWLKLSKAGFQFAYIPYTLASYRWFGENKSAVGGMKRLEEVEAVARRHGAPGMPAYFRLEAVLVHLTAAVAHLRSKNLPDAARAVASAFRCVITSRTALASLLDPNTWKIIFTGQVLRRRTRRSVST